MHGAKANVSGSTVSLRFDRPVEMDGFFLTYGGVDPLQNPAKLRVTYLDLQSADSEEKTIMQPKWWTDWGEEYASSEIWDIESSPKDTSTTTARMSASAPIAFTVGLLVESFIVFVGCSVALLTVFLGMYQHASRALSLTLIFLMLESLALWILLLATDNSHLSWRWLRASVVTGLLTLSVAVPSYEKALVPILLLASFVNLALLLADHILVRRLPSMLLRTQELYVGCAMLAVGVLLAILYSRMLKSVRLLVKQDKQAFDDAWKQILSTTPVDTIEELWRTVKILSPSSTRGRPIQQIRASRNAWPVATPKPNGDGTATPERERSFTAKQHSRTLLNSDATKEKVEVGPVQSVDQLFAQAASASVLLRRKAQQAALASNGAFPVSPRPAFRGPEGEAQQFMTLRDMQLAGVPLGPEGHEEDEERERDEGEEELPREEEQGGGQGALAVQWTDIKPSKRAIDKVLKQYHGEVHRLLDVCRESIIFEDFLGIAACIRALASDPHVVIERIKNSLDPTLDASPTAGFRAVSLNIRIVSPLSRWLCVDGHVCELLLTLRPLAQCMTHQSHQQYLQLRNFRVASRIPGLLSTLLPFGRWVGHTPQELPLSLTSPRVLNASRQIVFDTAEWLPTSAAHRRAPSAFTNFSTAWDESTAGAGFGDFVARRLPAVAALVPAAWRRNRVHSEDDVELGAAGPGGASVFGGNAMARIDPDSPFKSPTHADRKFLGDGGPWRSMARSGSTPNLALDVGAGVFGDCDVSSPTFRRSSLSGVSTSPPRLVRQTTSNLSTESRPPRLRRTSVSLIREESGQTEATSEREGGKWLCAEDLGSKAPRMEILRWQYVRRALLPGGVLDRMRCRIEAAVADVELFSVFETSYPIAAALCKRPVRFALLGTVLLYAAMVYIDTTTLRAMGQVRSATHIRFQPTRLRSGAPADSAVPAVHSVGLMQDGCMIETTPDTAMTCAKGECVVDLGGAWDFNGFFFVTNDETRAMDPVAFTLDAKSDAADGGWPEDGEWVRVGSWRRMVTLSGGHEWMIRRADRDSEASDGSEVVLASEHLHLRGHGVHEWEEDESEWEVKRELGTNFRDAEYETSSGTAPIVINSAGTPRAVGGAVVQVEMRAPWHSWLGSWMLHFEAMGTAMALWYVSKIGRPGWGRAIVVGSLLSVACCLAVNAGAETVARGGGPAFPLQWANAGAMMAIGVGLLVREQLALLLWLYAAVHFIVVYTVEDWMVHEVWGEGDHSPGLSSYPIASFVFVGVGVFFLVMRRQLHINSAQGIAQDMAEYREAWRQVCEDEHERLQLERVGNICSNVWSVTVANGGAQQRCRLKDVEFSNSSAMRRSPSVGAAKVLDFFQSAWSASRKNSHASRRRLSSVILGSAKPLSLETHTPRTSASRTGGPRSPATLGTPTVNVGQVRSPLAQKRDSEAMPTLGLRTPDSAVVRQPESVAPSPSEAPGSAASATRVVMLSKVRRRSESMAAMAEQREREKERAEHDKGGVWGEWLRMMGLASAERAPPAAATPNATLPGAGPGSGSAGSLSRSGSRWGFGSSRGSGSHATSRSGSLRRGGSSGDGWKTFRTFSFKFGWRSGRKSVASRSSGRLSRTGSWSVGAQGQNDGRLGTRRVLSLDQLYVQASGVYPLLKEKVKEWAWNSHGCLRMKRDKATRNRKESSLNGGHFERWDLLAGDANLERMVRWATLKKRQRASEKLVRSYQGKVWKLLDICRQSMVFDSVGDLADCLQLILQDPAVLVVSVKNRLAIDYDDKETAGYRDVNINLCFQSEVAKQLGIDTHVCELQLLLRSFAELKTDSGHVRYVRFRNARAQ